MRRLRVPPSVRWEPIASVRDDGDPLESDPLCPYVPDGYDGELPPTLKDRFGGSTSAPDAAD